MAGVEVQVEGLSSPRRFSGQRQSVRAGEILANWGASLAQFRMVMPVEYRRALAALRSLGMWSAHATIPATAVA